MIPKTKAALRDSIGDTMLRSPRRQFPDWEDFEGAFHCMVLGVEKLRARLGDAHAHQILEMLSQAKAHYEAGENELGGALMEDTKMVVMSRQPWAYPKEFYRWPRESSLPELSETDVRSRELEGD